jgi:hypothetical protein
MNTRRSLNVSGTVMLALVAVLAVMVGLTQAQGPETEGQGVEVANVGGRIPIQGRLTDASGTPVADGTYSVRFALYDAATGGNEVCADTNTVTVEDGLFYSEIWGDCTSVVINGQQLYLGIKVESDAEMTPRQPILPVPYAFSLKPGAIISATTSNAILHIENWSSAGRGLRAYAMAETGANYGVVGASRSPNGFGGYFYNNGGGTGLYGESSATTGETYGVHGESTSSSGRGVHGEATSASGGVGVEGISTIGSGVYASSGSGFGLYGRTGAASNNYGLFTPDNIYSLNYHSSGAMMHVMQNGGEDPLEPGDVVVFAGLGSPLGTGGLPTIQVVGATAANSSAVAGVVYSRYSIEALTGAVSPENVAEEVTPGGPVLPGEFLLVVVQGPTRVKVTALGGAIRPGDLLSSAAQAGRAGRATEISFEGTSAPIPGTVLGKALEPLDEGAKSIYVFVTLQ